MVSATIMYNLYKLDHINVMFRPLIWFVRLKFYVTQFTIFRNSNWIKICDIGDMM